jgi:hypothetical protein
MTGSYRLFYFQCLRVSLACFKSQISKTELAVRRYPHNALEIKNMNKPILLMVILICLVMAGCKETEHNLMGGDITQPVSGPIDIGREWTELVPPKPLRAVSFSNYLIVAAKGLDETLDTSRFRSIKFPDGSTGKIEARLYDEKGNAVDFDYYVWSDKNVVTLRKKGTRFPEDGGTPATNPDFPYNTTFVRVQIRSDVNLHCDSVEWGGHTGK